MTHDALSSFDDLTLAIGLATETVVDDRPLLRDHCERRLDRLSSLPPSAVESELEETARASSKFRVYEEPAEAMPTAEPRAAEPPPRPTAIRRRRGGRARRR